MAKKNRGGGARKLSRSIKRARYYVRHPEKKHRAARDRGYMV